MTRLAVTCSPHFYPRFIGWFKTGRDHHIFNYLIRERNPSASSKAQGNGVDARPTPTDFIAYACYSFSVKSLAKWSLLIHTGFHVPHATQVNNPMQLRSTIACFKRQHHTTTHPPTQRKKKKRKIIPLFSFLPTLEIAQRKLRLTEAT